MAMEQDQNNEESGILRSTASKQFRTQLTKKLCDLHKDGFLPMQIPRYEMSTTSRPMTLDPWIELGVARLLNLLNSEGRGAQIIDGINRITMDVILLVICMVCSGGLKSETIPASMGADLPIPGVNTKVGPVLLVTTKDRVQQWWTFINNNQIQQLKIALLEKMASTTLLRYDSDLVANFS